METNLRKTIQKIVLAAFPLVFLSFIYSLSSEAQMLDMMEEAEVRSLDDFIGRFNADTSSEFIKFAITKSPEGKLQRREILAMLFNRSQAWNDTMRLEFVNYIDNKYSPRFFNILKDSILAEVNTIAEINNENFPVKIILCFHSEPDKQRWEIVNIQSPFFSRKKNAMVPDTLMPELIARLQEDSVDWELKYYIVPSDHNVDFMNIDEIFQNPHFLYYCSASACSTNRNIQLFYQLIKGRKIKFKQKKSVHFYFDPWPMWNMKVSYVGNQNVVSGWLITGVYLDPQKELIHSLLKN